MDKTEKQQQQQICAWCAEAILPGEPSVSDEGGEAGARMHIACSAAERDGADIDNDHGDSN